MSKSLWLACIATLAGCEQAGTTGHPIDGATHGTVSCSSDTPCGTNQVCIAGEALPDDGGIPAACADVPAFCTVFDCGDSGEMTCPTCVVDICPSNRRGFVDVHGRTLTCL